MIRQRWMRPVAAILAVIAGAAFLALWIAEERESRDRIEEGR